MVDLEFSRVGPCAFDMGCLLATLLLLFYRQKHVTHVQQRHQRGHDAAQGKLDSMGQCFVENSLCTQGSSSHDGPDEAVNANQGRTAEETAGRESEGGREQQMKQDQSHNLIGQRNDYSQSNVAAQVVLDMSRVVRE